MAGPFDWKTDADWDTGFVGEPEIDLAATYKNGEEKIAWKPVAVGDGMGLLNLHGLVAARERCFAYAYTEIEVAEAGPAQLRVGSDDGNRLWLNGKQVVGITRWTGARPLDQDIVDCELVKGVNRILAKISQGGGGWTFCMRITRAGRDGHAVYGAGTEEIERPCAAFAAAAENAKESNEMTEERFPVGAQSYSFREFDLAGALNCLKELGADTMEFCGVHFPCDAADANLPAVKEAIAAAAGCGCRASGWRDSRRTRGRIARSSSSRRRWGWRC